MMITDTLRSSLRPGDVVFTRIDNLLYRHVAKATQSWTSHVGVLVSDPAGGLRVAESRVPRCAYSALDAFIARSENGMYAIRRPETALTGEQQAKLEDACAARMGGWYHLGFAYDSPRQYCSKLVYDVLLEATGVEVGILETFEQTLSRYPDCPQTVWKLWFFGRIPWQRRAVTPASQYRSEALVTVADYGLP
jgi:hypothetical protein